MTGIPDTYKDLFQKKAFAHLATVGADGSPQVTPVWVDFDGTHIRFNTAKGRVKDKNLRRNPKAALSIQDPDNPYRYMQVRGRVAEITEQGADAHIDALAKKYINKDKYPWRRPDEVRVTYKILPEKIHTLGEGGGMRAEPYLSAVTETELRHQRAKARVLRGSQWWKRRIAAGRCHYCGCQVGPRALSMDHVVPLIRGGRCNRRQRAAG